MEEKAEAQRDALAESLEVLFANMSVMVKGELQEVPRTSSPCSDIHQKKNHCDKYSPKDSTNAYWEKWVKFFTWMLENYIRDGTSPSSLISWSAQGKIVFSCFTDTKRGANNQLELLEKMNLRVEEEYNSFGDVASGLRVFVEQLKEKNGSFDEYIQQIDSIDQQVTEFEAVVSMLDKYVSLLESKVQQAFSNLAS